MIKAMKDLDKETRDGLGNFVGILFKSNFRLVLEGIQAETEKKSTTIQRLKKKLQRTKRMTGKFRRNLPDQKTEPTLPRSGSRPSRKK